jgi:hypothetical protein
MQMFLPYLDWSCLRFAERAMFWLTVGAAIQHAPYVDQFVWWFLKRLRRS